MMNSTCLAFNKLSIALYLSKCWGFVNNNSSIKLTISTILQLCSALILDRISFRIDKTIKLKRK